ncbi:hypothetical protein [Lactiplantibacillus xiangfangensis]|uniref:Bacterial archaeo-eukaryotic release factor family 6 domain-containing protein n=1 Tax=Lactiplantibacillus xiangfangensis TaxID=942150 RepID=A0A0R2MBA9_9LACO|nr:hypothetical protein [Lactiplantibacillus xiangfangensis]KRO11049.1 hypothetical protein IV64_GL002748 [Lactiplantibacillus xiangfangensis]
MDTMVKNDLTQLMAQRDAGPFIAIYLNTAAVLNDLNRQRLEFKQLVNDARTQLAQRFPSVSFQPFREQFERLIGDNDFWLQHTGPQTSLIANEQQVMIFDLQYPTDNQVIVNSMPAIRPILADRQHEFDFDLLALNEDSLMMYQQRQGNFTIVDLPSEAPTTLQATLGTEKRGGDLNFNSSPVHGVNYHGHNAKAEEREIDQKNYYQQVAQYMQDYSQTTQRPLILMGLPHNQSLFRQINKNPYLSEYLSIPKSPKNLSLGAIQTATEAIQTKWHTQLADIMLDRYDKAQSKQLALSDPFGMIKPALSGRIEMLIVASSANVAGTLPSTEVLLDDPIAQPDNLIDDLVDVVMAKNGQVRIIPADKMPTDTGALALLRY